MPWNYRETIARLAAGEVFFQPAAPQGSGIKNNLGLIRAYED
jgi:hypothetical protein